MSRKIVHSATLILIFCLSAFCIWHDAEAQVNAQQMAKVVDEKVKVDIYPNPTSDQITIDLSETKVTQPIIEIRSIIGSKMQVQIESLSKKKYKVDVSRFPRGYYLVLVREDRQKFQQTVRFSKK